MAANPSILIRIAANLAELKSNLKEGKDQIETTTQAMHKLASSFEGSKLEQAAHNMVAAVNQVGGAAKLTEAEQARVNRTLDAFIEKAELMGRTVPKAMRDLAAETAKVSAPIDQVAIDTERLVEKLTGGAIPAAHLYVAAVEKMGGATKLTAAEQQQVNAILTAAIDKYRALGQEAPETLVKLAEQTKRLEVNYKELDQHGVQTIQQITTETKGADKETATLTDTVKRLALGFAAMFTARAAFNFVNATVQEASALSNLSNEVRIGVEELQLMTAALSQFGIDADQLGKGLFTLSRKIATGDESVSVALGRMGMAFEDLDGLNGQELFLKIERGLAALQGGLRDDTAADLFGDKLGRAMAGASEGIDGAMAKARELNVVMSEETVAALDAYGNAIERANRNLSNIAANMMGPVAEGFNHLNDAWEKGAGKWNIVVAMMKDWAASNSITGASTQHLAKLLDETNQKADIAAKNQKAAAAATTEHGNALNFAADSGRIWGDGMAGALKAAADLDKELRAFSNTLGGVPLLLDGMTSKLEELPEKFRGNFEETEKFSLKSLNAIARAAENDFLRVQAAPEKFRVGAVEHFRAVAEAAKRDVLVASGAWVEGFDAIAQGAVDTAAKVSGATRVMLGQLHNVASFQNPYALSGSMSPAEMAARAAELGGKVAYDSFKNPYVHVPGKNSGPVPSFASGVTDFAGGVARVHRDELLVNLPKGTDVIPAGRSGLGGGITIAPVLHFHGPVMGSSWEFEQAVSGAIVNLVKSGAIAMPSSV